jgi:hypothetical protein
LYWGCMQQVCYSTMKDRWELWVNDRLLKFYFHHSWHNWKCSPECQAFLENLKRRLMYSNPIHTFLHKHFFYTGSSLRIWCSFMADKSQ